MEKKDWLMVSKFDIGDKVWSIAFRKYYKITQIIFKVYNDRKEVFYNTTDNVLFNEIGLLEQAPILDNSEKRFLANFLIPLKAKKIRKIFTCDKEYECIDYLIGKVWLSLPVFKAGTMYQGLELGKAYTLKELGLYEKQYKY